MFVLPLSLSRSACVCVCVCMQHSMRRKGKKTEQGSQRPLASHVPQLLSYKHSNFQTFFLPWMSWGRRPFSIVLSTRRNINNTLLLPALLQHTAALGVPTTPCSASDLESVCLCRSQVSV